jgi:hypothetical protein
VVSDKAVGYSLLGIVLNNVRLIAMSGAKYFSNVSASPIVLSVKGGKLIA